MYFCQKRLNCASLKLVRRDCALFPENRGDYRSEDRVGIDGNNGGQFRYTQIDP